MGIAKNIALGFCLLGLSGCSYLWGPSHQQVPEGTVRVEMWTMSLSPTFDDYINGLVEGFEAQHPGVEVVWVDLPQSATLQKLMTSIAGGVAPDLVNLNTELALTLAQKGSLVAVSEKVTPEERGRYFEGIWNATTYAEKSYGIPWYVTTRVLMYNKKIYREAGLKIDEPPRTWQELDAQVRQVHQKTDYLAYMPAIKILNDWAMWDVAIVDEGSQKVAVDQPEAVARLERYAQLMREGVIPQETLTESYRGALDRYKSGRLAVLEAGPQFLLKIEADAPGVYQNTEVAPLPVASSGQVPAATMNFVVPRASQNQELAVELALWMTSPENQLEFDKLVPILPSTRATVEDAFFREGRGEPLKDKAVAISVQQLGYASDFSLALPQRQLLMEALNEGVESALYLRETPQEALSGVQAKWERILRKEGYFKDEE